jgi:hypothetical protein
MAQTMLTAYPDRFKNPQDADRVARSMFNDGKMPDDFSYKPDTRDSIRKAETMLKFLPYVGDIRVARVMGDYALNGGDPFDALPDNFETAIQNEMRYRNRMAAAAERGATAQETQVKIEELRWKAELEQAKTAFAKLEASEQREAAKIKLEKLQTMLSGKFAVAPGMQEQALKELATDLNWTVQERSGVKWLLAFLHFPGVDPYEIGPRPTAPNFTPGEGAPRGAAPFDEARFEKEWRARQEAEASKSRDIAKTEATALPEKTRISVAKEAVRRGFALFGRVTAPLTPAQEKKNQEKAGQIRR